MRRGTLLGTASYGDGREASNGGSKGDTGRGGVSVRDHQNRGAAHRQSLHYLLPGFSDGIEVREHSVS